MKEGGPTKKEMAAELEILRAAMRRLSLRAGFLWQGFREFEVDCVMRELDREHDKEKK